MVHPNARMKVNLGCLACPNGQLRVHRPWFSPLGLLLFTMYRCRSAPAQEILGDLIKGILAESSSVLWSSSLRAPFLAQRVRTGATTPLSTAAGRLNRCFRRFAVSIRVMPSTVTSPSTRSQAHPSGQSECGDTLKRQSGRSCRLANMSRQFAGGHR